MCDDGGTASRGAEKVLVIRDDVPFPSAPRGEYTSQIMKTRVWQVRSGRAINEVGPKGRSNNLSCMLKRGHQSRSYDRGLEADKKMSRASAFFSVLYLKCVI